MRAKSEGKAVSVWYLYPLGDFTAQITEIQNSLRITEIWAVSRTKNSHLIRAGSEELRAPRKQFVTRLIIQSHLAALLFPCYHDYANISRELGLLSFPRQELHSQISVLAISTTTQKILQKLSRPQV